MKPVATVYRNDKGIIFHLKVVTSKGVADMPVSGSSERVVRKTIKDIFGKCQVIIIDHFKNGIIQAKVNDIDDPVWSTGNGKHRKENRS